MYNIKKQYKNDEEKQTLIKEFEIKGYRLTEEHNHTNGDFLVFGGKTKYHDFDEDLQEWYFDLDHYITYEVRPERNKLLAETDHLMLVDNYESLSETQKTNAKLYRQKLRDLPETIIDETTALDVVWPER